MIADDLDKEECTEKATLSQGLTWCRSALAPVVAVLKCSGRHADVCAQQWGQLALLQDSGLRDKGHLLLRPYLEQRDGYPSPNLLCFLRPHLNRAARIISQCHFHVSLDPVLN